MRMFYSFFLLIVIPAPVFSYIDPATGSMLFSALVGILATVYFLSRQLIMKIRLFTPGSVRQRDTHSLVLYNEGPQYWGVFKPLLEELARRQEPCTYLCASPEDPGLSFESEFIKARYIGQGNRAYFQLNMLEADLMVATTPGLDVLQFKRSRRVKHYCHILHHLNNTATYRLFGIDYYDSVLLNGPHQPGIIRELERHRKTPVKDLRIIGSTYLDSLMEKKRSLSPVEHDGFTVLVSPSWGPNSLLSRYGTKLLDPLAQSGLNVILRPHPQSSLSEKKLLDRLQEELSVYKNISWDFDKENIYAMQKADVMISDFSSIMFDFIFLFSRPVAVFNFELDPRGFDLSDIIEENPYYMVKDSGAILHFDAENLNLVLLIFRLI